MPILMQLKCRNFTPKVGEDSHFKHISTNVYQMGWSFSWFFFHVYVWRSPQIIILDVLIFVIFPKLGLINGWIANFGPTDFPYIILFKIRANSAWSSQLLSSIVLETGRNFVWKLDHKKHPKSFTGGGLLVLWVEEEKQKDILWHGKLKNQRLRVKNWKPYPLVS